MTVREMSIGDMMLLPPRPGTCPECAVNHDPGAPHNRDSLTYQYKFYDQHGRFPSWADAMEHCDPEVKEAWTQALEAKGVKVQQNPEVDTLDVQISPEGGEAS